MSGADLFDCKPLQLRLSKHGCSIRWRENNQIDREPTSSPCHGCELGKRHALECAVEKRTPASTKKRASKLAAQSASPAPSTSTRRALDDVASSSTSTPAASSSSSSTSTPASRSSRRKTSTSARTSTLRRRRRRDGVTVGVFLDRLAGAIAHCIARLEVRS